MPTYIHHNTERKILEINVSGKLTTEDYEAFVPEIERLIDEHGKLRILIAMHDFHGWTAGALWEDIQFDARHFNDVERLAVLGEAKWERGMAVFCKPFTTAEIRYFDLNKPGEVERARTWTQSGHLPNEQVPAATSSGARG